MGAKRRAGRPLSARWNRLTKLGKRILIPGRTMRQVSPLRHYHAKRLGVNLIAYQSTDHRSPGIWVEVGTWDASRPKPPRKFDTDPPPV